MVGDKALGAVIVVSAILALSGFGYIYVFSSLMGGLALSPSDTEAGIQFSPDSNLEKVCDVRNNEKVFVECEVSFGEDFGCAVSKKAITADGSLAKPWSTLCDRVECVCN